MRWGFGADAALPQPALDSRALWVEGAGGPGRPNGTALGAGPAEPFQALISAAILFSGLVWVMHRAVVPADRPDWGYAGNMVILIFAYIHSRLQFRYSVLIGVVLIVMYNVGSLFIIHEATNNVIFGDYFLLLTTFIGSIGAYVLERSTRLLFLRERELDRERGRS